MLDHPMSRLVLKSVAVWLLILVLAILNGGFREAALLPVLGKPAAFVLSGLLLSACVVLVSLVFVRRQEGLDRAQSFRVGLLWLILTLAFEFGFGRLVMGRTWSELLEAYTFKDGNLWPLVLVVVFLAPVFAARLQGKR